MPQLYKKPLTSLAAGLIGSLIATECFADPNFPTRFTNIGSIKNTRHNLTQDPTGRSVNMDPYRNNYAEVCVYCHTPHGANSQTTIPLWNRTINNLGNYTTYDTLGTTSITADITQPGANSLTCLSCHDGTIAMDSVINMPGSGMYDAGQELIGNSNATNFLNSWTNKDGRQDANSHYAFADNGAAQSCMTCHSADGALGGTAPDFVIAFIGTDLTNDHPIGISIPTGRFGSDFFEPDATASGASWSLTYYDTNSNARADKEEIRFYNDRVECASCHDPHGVIPVGSDPSTTEFNPTFLRVSNDASAVCLTCHDK